jgi:hypothetical protein
LKEEEKNVVEDQEQRAVLLPLMWQEVLNQYRVSDVLLEKYLEIGERVPSDEQIRELINETGAIRPTHIYLMHRIVQLKALVKDYQELLEASDHLGYDTDSPYAQQLADVQKRTARLLGERE